MPAMNRLTALKVQKLKEPGRYADGGNLFLSIGNGGKSWTFLYRDRGTGRLREMGLGAAASVPLQEARERAAAARRLIRDGIDPIADKKAKRAAAAKVETFGAFTDRFIKTLMPGFRNAKHQYQWEATLTTHAAALRDLPLKDITTDDVRRVLEPIWHAKHETAKRLRGRLERVFAAAKSAGLREGDNPAAWKDNLKPLLQRPAVAVRHHPALPYSDAPQFMRELRERSSTSARALEFTILSAARTGETIGARWREVDFAARLWTVPGERMKAGRPHEVPLSDRALALLRELPRGKPDDFIFRGAKPGKPLSNMAMLQALRDLRAGITTHGFRSTFRDWAGDCTTFPRDIVEFALAHIVESEVERAYRRSTALETRRELMQAWADFLSS